MYKDLLPIGSIVMLKGGEKRIMICGRIQTRSGDETIYDYSACYYPEGIVGSDSMFFFNHSSIEKIFFLGFQDEEELVFHEQVLDRIGELAYEDNKIVVKSLNEEE